jgi:predicted nucleotidyltransferase
VDNVQYETMMGSVAYGVSEDKSDVDVYGFCIPPKTTVFPHLAGEIDGFGRNKKRFEQFQAHHIEQHPKQYDVTVYSIVKYFSLLMENNPNMIDSIFTPRFCILHSTAVGEFVRESRKLFLHKGAWFKFKGYAYSQLHKMAGHERTGKRKELYEKHGLDLKFAYHVVRLLYEVEMILEEGDIDLQRHREHLKSIRRGDVSEEEIRRWAAEKEAHLEKAYETSTLRYSPDEPKIKKLLLDCLEHHYGSLSDAVVVPDAEKKALQEILAVVDRHRGLVE